MSDTVDIYEPVIADLRSRIATLQAMLDNLESLRSGVSPVALKLGLQARGTGITFDNDAFFQMTAGDATKKYLSAMKKTATIAAISDALLSGGWKTSSKNVGENLRAILSRHPDFVKINGEFGLAEWYPGRKAGPKKEPISLNPRTFVVEGDDNDVVELPDYDEVNAPMGDKPVMR
jgi:hypothetical protein